MANDQAAKMTVEDQGNGMANTPDMLCLLNDLNIDALIASLENAPEPQPATAPSAVASDERRAARRLTPNELAADLKLTMPNVTDLALVNISETGVLIETRKRLNPGTPTDLFVFLNGKRHATRATVVRSNLHAIKSGVVYRAALRFEKGLPIEALP
jgi:PilZ domain-containing protein